MLERIREIRTSERRFYQKITDIYALSVDYAAKSPATADFFAQVQNKLHWAITGQTAAELIYSSADATKITMGLSTCTWKQAPHGKILKSDVTVAKNYLNEAHIEELNRIVSAYLDLAENRAKRGILMTMADWATFLNGFLELSNCYLLKVPYSDDRELLGDILRFGADVQVLEPKELRAKVQMTLLAAVGKYI